MSVNSLEKPVTIAQIASEAGVSASAISSFLNSRSYGIRLSAETQRRVLDACRKRNYMPKSESAMRLLYPKLGNVCFLLNSAVPSGVQNEYFGPMLSGVLESLADPTESVAYSLFDPDTDYTLPDAKLPQAMRNGSATRFIAASSPNPSLVSCAVQAGLPFVYLGHKLDIPGLCCIVPDYVDATKQAVHYLAGLGHMRIAYLTGPFGERLYNMTEMSYGFSEGIRECGLPMHPQYIYHCESRVGEFSKENLAAAADHLMSLNPKPTAILCFHDPAAAVISAHLQSRGYRIPRDISIMGCNDTMTAETHHPALTTIHFPLAEMGARAIEELDKRITLGGGQHEQTITLPVSLVCRDSCAAPTSDQ